MSTQRFHTTIARSGTRTYLVIPFDPNEVWGVKSRHYVTGSIHGCPVRGVIDAESSPFFLPLGAAWRRDNGIEAGANVEVELAPDGPQTAALSPDVVAALDTEPHAKTFFESLAPFYRNNYIRWIESAGRPETRRRRIAEMTTFLNAGQKQR